MSVQNGERESTYTAFVKPFESTRSSLTVLRYSEVEQVLKFIFDKNSTLRDKSTLLFLKFTKECTLLVF